METDRKVVYRTPVFNLVEAVEDGRVRVALQCPQWSVMVPVTKDGRFVLVEQVRYATQELSLEAPGGKVEENESPTAAAERETLEETGYKVSHSLSTGWVYPNPALQDNRFFMHIGFNAELTAAQNLDDGERVKVVVMTVAQVRDAINMGRITHALALHAIKRALEVLEAISQQTISLERSQAAY